MAMYLSTVNPEAAEQLRAAGDWQPAGPALVEDNPAGRNLMAGVDFPVQSGQKFGDQVRPPPGPVVFDVGESVPSPRHHIPGVGNMVVYHLRAGDSRNRRTKFPAIVMDGDTETGLLKLWVIVDDGDTWMQDNVPARAGTEPGWALVEQPMAAPAPAPDSRDPLEYITHQLSQRVAALEAKRGPGRPKVTKDL